MFILFNAIDNLASLGLPVNITIMGSGPLEKECRAFASKDFGSVKVSYRNPIEYGSDFFNFLCNFDVVLVPNIKKEQPRIVFDAFSQGLGVIASDTSGILDITVDGENAIIFKSGDSLSLANAIHRLVELQAGSPPWLKVIPLTDRRQTIKRATVRLGGLRNAEGGGRQNARDQVHGIGITPYENFWSFGIAAARGQVKRIVEFAIGPESAVIPPCIGIVGGR